MAYLVYEYGCLPPVGGKEAACEQMYRRRRLWNTLVEIERKYRAAASAILHDDASDAGLDTARARLSMLRLEIQTRRRATRKRGVDVSDLRQQITHAKVELDGALAAAKLRRRTGIAEHKQQLELLEIERRLQVRQAQADSELYWCNYDDVIAAYESARRRALREGHELRFHGFEYHGKVTVRFQHGLPAVEAFGSDQRLQIDPVDPLAWSSPHRGLRRRLARSRVRLRTGSEGRAPVWLELPVVLHRPLPEDGTVRSASVIRDFVGSRERWRLLVTVSRPDAPRRCGPAVAVDFGWRLLPDGLRVAYWEDELGSHGSLILPPEVLWQFSKLSDLKSIQDHHLRTVLNVLSDWAQSRAIPDWMDLSRVKEWRKAWRLVRLHDAWNDRRTEGDDDAFHALTAWRERYRHLHEWEAHLRDQLIRHRKEIYRRFVAGLLRTHGTVFVEDLRISALARHAAPEENAHNYSGSMRVVAAVSQLAGLLKERGDCVQVSAAYTTRQCSWCGHAGEWDAAKSVLHRCQRCDTVFDQDRNAARNILRRGLSSLQNPAQGCVVTETAES